MKNKICHQKSLKIVYTKGKEQTKGGFFMEERKHYRVALNELKENPANGIYLTRVELQKYGIFAGILLILLTFFAVFDRKH